MMIASVIILGQTTLGINRPTELSTPDDQRLVQQASLLQILHLLGYDHSRFSYRFQGLDQKLTGVEHAKVIKELVG